MSKVQVGLDRARAVDAGPKLVKDALQQHRGHLVVDGISSGELVERLEIAKKVHGASYWVGYQ